MTNLKMNIFYIAIVILFKRFQIFIFLLALRLFLDAECHIENGFGTFGKMYILLKNNYLSTYYLHNYL